MNRSRPSSLWWQFRELESVLSWHFMMTSSNGNIFRVTGPLCGEFTGPGEFHKDQRRRALIFSLICAWISDKVNNREAGDLRRHCGYYDVNVIFQVCFVTLHEMRELFTPTQSYTFDVNKGGIGKSMVGGHKDRRWFNLVFKNVGND